MNRDAEKNQEILEVFKRLQEAREKLTAAVDAYNDITTRIELPKANYDQPRQRTPKSDRTGRIVAVREMYADAVAAAKADYLDATMAAFKLLANVKSTKPFRVLSERYIEGKSYEEISKSMDYSLAQVYRLRNQGLKEIAAWREGGGVDHYED